MKTLDFAPLYRSTVGFDRLVDLLDSSVRPDWPPYDIEKLNDDEYCISMAVAGFNQSEIEITQVGSDLQIVGNKDAPEGERQLLHRGIAARSFKQVFSLDDHVKVASASIDNGLLSILLVREVPEQLKPRRIEIGQGSQKQIGRSSNTNSQAKAA
jgi:molecular chaperone IbpA